MSLFQKSVEKKYLSELDKALIDKKFAEFQEYFGNAAIQENIRNAKEEQFQEGFLRELFVKIFDYTLNPQPNFNLTTELKNISNSKKADGAILRDENAIAVIELKSTDTTDLTTVETQAFGYKNHHPKCVYVITSNFEKLRFYIQNAVYHLEFDLFKLSKEDFSLMWLCLAKDSLLKDLPLKIKESSVVQEENITKLLYSDYSKFREAIFRNLVENNPTIDKLLLFKKTQKLIDRFLFIFFAEDKQLLPPNSINEIIQQWDELKDKYDEYFPLYERFKKYFGYLNTGYVGKKYSIYAYNGGLFTPDEILDNISIDDNILREHTLKLSNYDFDTDVDVNILGHIFEHSLGENENVEAEIKGEKVEQEKTRRKKDGIFYTPKYITKYIVENTIGKLCDEKRKELEIIDEEYAKGRKNRKKETIKVLDEKLKKYREWLLSLTILDPACGSGAFLNQALEFLIAEHKKIDELSAQLFGAGLVFSDITTDILEKNIFGVDLNEESVEIAKLSLWLRTAQKGRKLNTLSNNIKCGNSLIDDPEIAGEKAFNWQNEFPNIFAKGGFDVIIGNPPYLRIQGLKESYPELIKYYDTAFCAATGNYDIYALFIEKSYQLINDKGIVSFILPHKFLIADFGIGIRSFLIKNKAVSEIVHFGSELVFQDATTYTCIISLSRKSKSYIDYKQTAPSQIFRDIPFNQIEYSKLDVGQWILTESKAGSILEKINQQALKLNDIFDRFVQGIITGKDAVFCISGKFQGEFLEFLDENGRTHQIEKNILKPHLRGEDVNKYKNLINNEWLIFPYKINLGKAELYSPSEMEEMFPKSLEYLKLYENILRERENGLFNNDYWYQYSRNQAISVLEKPKIITPEVCFGGSMTLDLNNFYHNSKCHTLLLKEGCGYSLKSILPFLNSQLFWFYLSKSGNVLRGGYIGVKRRVLEPFPIPNPDRVNHNIFQTLTEEILIKHEDFQRIQSTFLELMQSKYEFEKVSNNLKRWYELDFKGFLNECKKMKISFNLSEEAEWMKYFNVQKTIAQDISCEIIKIEKKIDQMVYELYNLTEEEIKIVEESK
jgi:type I restriction-modification system DNA methylase subunit